MNITMKSMLKNFKCILSFVLVLFLMIGCSRTNYNPNSKIKSHKHVKHSSLATSGMKSAPRKKWIIKDYRRNILGAQKYSKPRRR